MAFFIVCYDLSKPGKDYSSLRKALASTEHCHVQESVWFIQHGGPSSALRDLLTPHFDPADTMFIDQITAEWAGLNMPACGKWLTGLGFSASV
jgi:hypothetical protein